MFLVSLLFVEMAEETDMTTPRPKRPREDNVEHIEYIADPAVFILINADRLHRCMLNLIGNRGGTISLIPQLQRGKQFIVILEK